MGNEPKILSKTWKVVFQVTEIPLLNEHSQILFKRIATTVLLPSFYSLRRITAGQECLKILCLKILFDAGNQGTTGLKAWRMICLMLVMRSLAEFSSYLGGPHGDPSITKQPC